MNSFWQVEKVISNTLSVLMIFVLLSATIQPEIDLCTKKLEPIELPVGHFSDNTVNANNDISIKHTNSRDSDFPSTQQTHWFCHLGHTCHLIFWLPITMAFRDENSLKTDIFLFPPKKLFLDGPFKPPKNLI